MVTAQPASDVLADLPTGTWTVDPAHSTVGFTVRHLMSRVRGRFDTFEATIVTGASPLDAHVSCTVDLASVNTGNSIRDDDLRSNRFFDVEQTPTMSFDSTEVRANGAGWVLDGELTMRSVTRPVSLDIEFLGYDETGVQGEARLGFTGRTTIRRSDFGVSFGNVDMICRRETWKHVA